MKEQEIIKRHFGDFFDNLKMESVKYFVETGTVNGAFEDAIKKCMKDFNKDEQYEELLSIVVLLVRCKEIKDNPDATEEEKYFYKTTKPLAWMKAKAFLTL